MFGRHFELKFVKTPKDSKTTETPMVTPEDVERIETLAHNIVKKVTIGAIAIIGAAAVLSTASQVTVNACDNRKKND